MNRKGKAAVRKVFDHIPDVPGTGFGARDEPPPLKNEIFVKVRNNNIKTWQPWRLGPTEVARIPYQPKEVNAALNAVRKLDFDEPSQKSGKKGRRQFILDQPGW